MPNGLPVNRNGITCKVEIGGHEGYIIANTDEAGGLKEVFIHGWGKQGSTQEGWTQVVAVLLSLGLQGEVQLGVIARHLAQMRFEPNGPTNDPEIPRCRSVPDYIARWLVLRFGDATVKAELKALDERLDA